MNKGGLLYNVISRSGTNQVHGGVTFSGIEQRDECGEHHARPEDGTAGRAQLPRRGALAQDRFVGNEILKLYDYGAWVGGPIVRDRLWFSGSTHIQGMDQYPLGSFDAAGNPVVDDYLMSTTTAKISWQMTKSAQLSYFDNLHYKGVYHRNGVGNNNTNFSDNLARTLNTKWPNVQQVKFTTPYRSNIRHRPRLRAIRDDDRFDPRPEVGAGAISRFDADTNTFTEAWPTYNFNLHKRDQAHASINYFAGKHDIRAGYSIVVNGKPSAIWSTSAMRAQIIEAVMPELVSHLQRRHLRPGDGARGRAAVHAGQSRAGLLHPGQVDADAQAGDQLWSQVRVQLRLAGRDVPAGDRVLHDRQCFDAIKGAPDLKNVLPRFAVVYDVQGDGRTAIKFAANRYDQPIQMEFVGRLNPVGAVNDHRQWLAQSQCNAPTCAAATATATSFRN